MHLIAAGNIIINACQESQLYSYFQAKRRARLTCGFDEAIVVLSSEQRIRQIPEELLQQTSNTIDIMVESLRIAKIQLTWIYLT